MTASARNVPDYDRLGYALAARVLQSDLYRQLDPIERAQCDELLSAAPQPAQPVLEVDSEFQDVAEAMLWDIENKIGDPHTFRHFQDAVQARRVRDRLKAAESNAVTVGQSPVSMTRCPHDGLDNALLPTPQSSAAPSDGATPRTDERWEELVTGSEFGTMRQVAEQMMFLARQLERELAAVELLRKAAERTIAGLQGELAGARGEPVAWRYRPSNSKVWTLTKDRGGMPEHWEIEPLYALPSAPTGE